MSWFLLALLSVIGISIANILRRVAMRGDKSNPYSYAVVFSLFLGCINLFFALIFHVSFALSTQDYFSVLFASLLWALGAVFLFKSVKVLGASEVTILSTLRAVVTILASLFFLHETFNPHQVIGALAIIFSVFLVSNLKKGVAFNSGVTHALLSAFFTGLALVMDSYNVSRISVLGYNTIANFIICLLLLIGYPKAVTQWRHFIEWSFLKNMLPLSFFSGLQGIAYLFALTAGGVTAQVGAITQSSVILTVLLAALFLQERSFILKKIIAGVLVTAGIVLLS